MLGTNGGGTLNANSMHPLSNPNGFTDSVQIFRPAAIPFALTFAFGRMVGRTDDAGLGRVRGHVVLWARPCVLLGAPWRRHGGRGQPRARPRSA